MGKHGVAKFERHRSFSNQDREIFTTICSEFRSKSQFIPNVMKILRSWVRKPPKECCIFPCKDFNQQRLRFSFHYYRSVIRRQIGYLFLQFPHVLVRRWNRPYLHRGNIALVANVAPTITSYKQWFMSVVVTSIYDGRIKHRNISPVSRQDSLLVNKTERVFSVFRRRINQASDWKWT